MKTTRISATIFSFFITLTIMLSGSVWGQLSITSPNSTVTQNFDALPSSGTGLSQSGGIFSSGWSFLEAGTNANTTYDAGTGSSNSGNTFSFGVAGINPLSDRAFGILQSGSLTSIIGFKCTNNTGSTVNSITIGYTGEVWRLSSASDVLNLSYQVGNLALNAATGWINVPGLTFTTPITGTSAAIDGNNTSNRLVINPVTISGLNLLNGSTITFRWVDATSSSSAGMAIDDFSIMLNVQFNTVSFDPNGGIGSMANQTASTSTALNSNTFTRSGYTFTGWNTAADGSGTPYANGASYPFTSSVTLFAQWCQNNTWLGSSTGNWSTAANWCGGAPTSSSNVMIANGTTVTLDNTSETIINDLTINGTLILAANSKLTVNGVLTNNGTLTIEDGATLDQGTASTVLGSGTYNVKQVITGAGAATPAGRFWYLGSPVATASSSVLFASNASNVVKKRDEANNTWVTLTSGTPENLEVGRGYYLQAANGSATPGNLTLTFTGGNINNGDVTTQNLTSAGAGFTGFNLVSNPYPSYVNWATVVKNNVDGTMWYRTHNGANMDFGTVNASGIGTTVGAVQLTQYIPPMQSFWVRVSNYGQAASLTFNNASRSHFVSVNGSTAGLRTAGINPSVFIRMNLKQGEKSDQLIVYTDELSSNGLDINDAEKMMQATNPQFYTMVGAQKTVINALNPSKKQQALPITMELPTTGVHSFMIEDLEIDNGLVWLEDKQEAIMQALEPGTVYEFYANSGINAERFVLHFQLLDTPTPTNTYNEVGAYTNFNGKGASVHAEAAGVVVIKLPASTEGNTDIQIRDAAGKLVYAGSTNTLETSVQLEQANGIYYVTLNGTSGVEVRKVFIQQ